jgi:amino acid adenylation domain-containing protein
MGIPEDATLPEIVQNHARTRPDALAIERGPVRLTYGELNREANRLARALAARGVGRGAVVGIHLGRSIEWVVAMLATLKAGAVVMTLDPKAPAERALRAVRAAEAAAVVTDPNGEPAASAYSVPVVVVGDGGRKTAAEQESRDTALPGRPEDADPDIPFFPDDLAYAVHTSGSSGKPKIVLAQHRWLTGGASPGSALNRTTSADRGAWLGPAGAGIAIHEVCGLLWRGASIHVAEQDVITSPPALRDWLIANRITQAFVITPLGEMLQALPWPEDCTLRLMTLGGAKLNRWAPADLPFEVAVSYGSLEAFQIANTLHPWEARCTPATATAADRAAPPPVGRPLPDVRVHVLEDDLTAVSAGALGELWIDSPALCLGYLGDPALTASRLRPNPFGAPGSRLYRSGDAGRYRQDGVLEHHGRIDDVVKIRGHRVEPGEVEWVLGSHPKVAQVCVVTVQDGDRSQLVACYVTGEPPSANASLAVELRAHVARRLPDFMVPVAYVRMDRLPMNTSDKVDRLSLPPADWREWRPVQPYREPRGDAEVRLAKLFSELLSVERVGADDNFFELGGDSLLAARLRSAVEEAFGIPLALSTVMTAGTPGELAGHLATASREPAGFETLPPIVPRDRS